MRAAVPELVHRVDGEDVEGIELPDPREVEERVAPQISSGPPHERARRRLQKGGCHLRPGARTRTGGTAAARQAGTNACAGEDRDHGEHKRQRGPGREREQEAEADHRQAERERARGRDSEVARPAREAKEQRARQKQDARAGRCEA